MMDRLTPVERAAVEEEEALFSRVRASLEGAAGRALPDRSAPYVGHFRVEEDGERRDYLLGHTTFIDGVAGVRIVDWRLAPVARVFYRYREGDTFAEDLPGRSFTGRLLTRRIIAFRQGHLSQIVGDGLVLIRTSSGEWRGVPRERLDLTAAGDDPRPDRLGLGLGAGRQARSAPSDVTARMDAEQFAAVTAPAETPLLVLGSAGSGKTTVALHRLARLAALEPERFPLEACRVIVPGDGLARLAKRLLAPLGSADARVATIDAAFGQLARYVLGKLPPVTDETPALVQSLKRHWALYEALRERPARRSRRPPTLRRLRRELATLLTDRSFLGEIVERARGALPSTAVEETVRHTMRQLDDSFARTLESITDEERKVAVDGRPIIEGTPDEVAGTVDPEDLPLLLLLRGRTGPIEVPEAAHLVLDEAEDFSLAELESLGALVRSTRCVTLAGDEAQQTLSSFGGWSRSTRTLGVGEPAVCRLATSYRCPRPITELARQILGPLAPTEPARAAREGAPVGRFRFATQAHATLFLLGALGDLLAREPFATVAVIASDAASARRLFGLLEELPGARLVLDGEFSFEPGLDVTDVDSTKGLEFDYVLVPDATADVYPAFDEARRRLHVAVTRASHQLWLLCAGTPSPLVGAAGFSPDEVPEGPS